MIAKSTITVSVDEQADSAKQLAAIQQWPHWQEIGLVAAKEYAMTQGLYEELLPEYQRFLLLAMHYHGIGMFHRQIDNIWHSYILSTKRYQEFAETFNEGRFINHLPQIGLKAQNTCTVCKSCKGCSAPHCDSEGSHALMEAGLEPGSVEHFRSAYLQTFDVEPVALWQLPQPSTEPDGLAQ